MMFVSGVQDRFRIEPRAAYMKCACWLVAYDLVKNEYVKEEGSKKAYAKWYNSTDAFKELERRLKKGEL